MSERATGLKRWLTTTDHKDIGILYLVTSLFMAVFGGSFAGLLRAQLSAADLKFLNPDLYNQFLSMHGTLMHRVRFSITVSVTVWYVVHGTHFFSRTVSVR